MRAEGDYAALRVAETCRAQGVDVKPDDHIREAAAALLAGASVPHRRAAA